MTNFAFLYLMGQPAGTSGPSNLLIDFSSAYPCFRSLLFLHDQTSDEKAEGYDQLQKFSEKRR